MGRSVEERLLELEELGKKESWPGDDDMLWLVKMVRKYRAMVMTRMVQDMLPIYIDWLNDLTGSGRGAFWAHANEKLEEIE